VLSVYGYDGATAKAGSIFTHTDGSFRLMAPSGEAMFLSANGSTTYGMYLYSDGSLNLAHDNQKITYGAAASADSYRRYTGSVLEDYSATKIYLNSANVGVGIADPLYPLQVSENMVVSGSGGINSQYAASGSVGASIGPITNHALYLKTNNTTRITIASDGEVVTATGRIEEAGTFGSIYVHDNSTATSVATGATYTLFDQWGVDGESSNVTPASASNKITIPEPGRYLVTCSTSVKSGTANVVILASVFLDGVEQDQLHYRRKISTAGDEGAATLSGIIDVDSASEDLDLRLRHDNGSSVNITVTYANLSVVYLGET
jgi:hypothetical protein